MFIREKTSPTTKRTYLQVVQAFRENGKPKQRIVASLGCLQELKDSGELEKIAKGLLKFLQRRDFLLDVSTQKEIARLNWGAPVVFRKLWDLFGLDEMLLQLTKDRSFSFDYFSAVFLMLLDRTTCPSSKLKSYSDQSKYLGISKSKLHHLYRALDILAEGKDALEVELYEKGKDLFNLSVDVVFFDTTTLYFESTDVSELKDFGFSKDNKINQTQVVFSLIINRAGRPIGFEVFSGDTFEGKTVREAIDKLKEKFNIDRLIFVGDRGIFSADTFSLLEKAGYDYIISSRIRNKSKKVTDKILEESWDYKNKDGSFKYKELAQGRRRLIVTYSLERARADFKKRGRLIEKAKKLIESKAGLSKTGGRKYLKVALSEVALDEEKIAQDSRFDGLYGIETNNQDMPVKEIADKYKELWQIEDAFRVLKSHLEARPVFHYTDRRIKGHLVLCFLAFLLERTLELELKASGQTYSPSKIREILLSLEVSEVEIEQRRFFLRSSLTPEAESLLKSLKIKPPPNLTLTSDF